MRVASSQYTKGVGRDCDDSESCVATIGSRRSEYCWGASKTCNLRHCGTCLNQLYWDYGTITKRYPSQLDAVHADAQMTAVLAGVSRTQVGEGTFSLHIDEAPSDEECGDHLHSQKDGENDCIDVIFHSLFIHRVSDIGH